MNIRKQKRMSKSLSSFLKAHPCTKDFTTCHLNSTKPNRTEPNRTDQKQTSDQSSQLQRYYCTVHPTVIHDEQSSRSTISKESNNSWEREISELQLFATRIGIPHALSRPLSRPLGLQLHQSLPFPPELV